MAYSKRAFQIPLGARTAKGVPLPQVLPIGTSETVTSVIPVVSFDEPAQCAGGGTAQDGIVNGDVDAASHDNDEGADDETETIDDFTEDSAASSSPSTSASMLKKSGAHLVLMTTQGIVKRTPLRAFKSISSRGLTIISLEMGDKLKWARLCGPEDDVLIATKYADLFQYNFLLCL